MFLLVTTLTVHQPFFLYVPLVLFRLKLHAPSRHFLRLFTIGRRHVSLTHVDHVPAVTHFDMIQ